MTIFKRVFDLAISIIVFSIFFPVIAFTAIVIFITMGRPILFIQQRPGYKGNPFSIFKFRTMSNDLDEFGNLLPGDQRVTRIGKIIRKFSLDELLQLLNVLKGDLSLVGPRPLLMEYLARYSSEQMRRHDVIPGITGWAQVNGRNAISWKKRFELDTWYVDNWSHFLDIKILFMTFLKLFKREDIDFKGGTTELYFMGEGQKKLIIMRGLPGSGKSYLAKKLGAAGVVFSTDDFFMERGVYKFDYTKIGQAHNWNLERAKWAIKDGLSPVVIDNTNVLAWESKKYVKFAIKNGYEVEIRLPETSWAFDLQELGRRNGHNLPEEVIKKMFENFNKNLTVTDILNSSRPS